MIILYKLFLSLINTVMAIASLFKPKAKLWYQGRKGLLKHIAANYKSSEKTLWLHAASLGEFEQGRPLIEKLKGQHPDYQVVLTFFSPSGYEIRKNYEGADYVYYLPLDSPTRAKEFIELIQPSIAIFVKYEFWYYYLKTLNDKHIPTYLISAVFRKEHLFFKSYGGWYRKMLGFFDHIFTQDINSLDLLKTIDVTKASVSGDTRFDRVAEITDQVQPNAIAEAFKSDRTMFIAGSSWPADEEIFCRYINENRYDNMCWLIAPHEIDNAHVLKIIDLISKTKKVVRYSEATPENVVEADVLIVDNIGLLSSLYAYGDIAHIGGGFVTGIHNTLEAATFGMPITFGPNYNKFNEAHEMIALGCAFGISTFEEFAPLLERFIDDKDYREKCAGVSSGYVRDKKGATEKVFQIVF